MEHEQFITGYRYMREANISQAMVHLCNKSEAWVKQNIPSVQYEDSIYNFIRATNVCIHITENVMVYEVSGEWQIITKKDTIPT